MDKEERRNNDADKILFVTVLYGQKLSETNAYKTLLRYCRHVFIQDNSPEESLDIPLPEGWKYTRDAANPGLSRAYNSAAAYARQHGFQWIMITDQDTAYQPGAVERMSELIRKYPDEAIFIPKVKIPDGRYISPVPLRNFFTRPEAEPLTGDVELRKTAIINSGIIVNLEAFEKCGGYNENVFLDFSDFQFIDRLSRVTRKGIVSDEEILQSFSATEDTGEKQIRRFSLFCRSLKGYEKRDIKTAMALIAVVAKRALSLTLRRKNLRPLGIMLKDFF